MNYGYPLPQRIEYINALNRGSQISSKWLKYKNRMWDLPIYLVSIDLPKYRLANGRTKARQEEYLSTHPQYPKDFFTRDLESESAQAEQHNILKNLLKAEQIDLMNFFTKNSQEEPLILDSNGYVVNGNRRLCTFRELYYSDPIAYKSFENVYVIILPMGSEEDIDKFEATIQMTTDIKAKYSWITQACMFRYRQETSGYTEEQLADIYQMKESEIVEELLKLQSAERYLNQIGRPKQYSIVEQHGYAFRQIRLNEKLMKANDPETQALKTLMEDISFKVIENNEDLGLGRDYETINILYSCSDKLLDTMKEELTPLINDSQSFTDNDNLFELDSSTDANIQFINLLESRSQDESVLEIIKNAVTEERDRKTLSNKKYAAIKHITKAHSELIEALGSLNDETNTKGIMEQLNNIELKIAEIRKRCSI